MVTREEWMRRLMFGAALTAVTFCAASLGALSVIVFQVFFGDDSVLKKSAIMSHINEETIIFTQDEETRIGSFFDQSHRRYIPIDEIPAHLINAFIASEDKNFYHHIGVDPVAISSAFFDGLVRGRFVRGGSTITQQTVKNLLDRREHSFRRKFREWIYALQLERLYEKRQIMEFYLNQFHVALNGNGVGIAAQYYFDKDVRELSLTEAAFIAGSVKGPSKYNPFIKFTEAERVKAQSEADARKNYVLRRMYEQGWITKEELKEAWDQSVPFEKGKFQSKEVALVSLIRSQMNKKEILEACGIEDLADLNRAGLKVYTTIDIEMQRSAQLMMRRNLSRLETILKGFAPEDPEDFKAIRDLEDNEFYFGKVLEIDRKAGKESITLDFGYPKGVIPHDSLVRYAKQMDVAAPIGFEKRLKQVMDTVKVGDVLFVEVRSYDRQANSAILELQKRPQVSGGLIALDKGEVRALVSGFDPHGYNRAIFATRQPGSVFKSVVYYAALQLGWNVLDQLDNERRVFPYQGQFYYPRPDHATPYQDTSMLWSGVKSENLASVYLTYKLVEKLNFEQFTALMGSMGLLPSDGESERDFHFRVARKLGVQLDNDGIREYELGNAIRDVEPDLVFRRENELLRRLQRMWWGKGYQAEMQSIYKLEAGTFTDSEVATRLRLIKNNYQRHQALKAFLTEDWQAIEEKVLASGAEGALADAQLQRRLARFRVMSSTGSMPSLGYFRVLEDEEPKETPSRSLTFEATEGRSLNSLDIQAIWGESGFFSARAGISLSDVLMEGYLPLGTFNRVQQQLDDRYQAVMAIDETYDLLRYYHHHDFRVALGLNYLKDLSKQMGVFSKLDPVLSFPLGTNDVSVTEVAKIYQTFVEGKIYQFYKDGPANQVNFIRKIEDRFGNLLWEAQHIEHQLVDPSYSVQMREVLRKVVTHGTGRLARGELYVSVGSEGGKGSKEMRVRVPAFGKTGTTNDYTTASFAGFIPYPVTKGAALNPKDSYVLASYVGYDLNQQMVRGGYNVGGAFGALPVWTDLARSIIKEKNYGEYLDRFDLSVISRQEWPLVYSEKTEGVRIDLPRGLILQKAESDDPEQFATTNIQETGELPYNEFAIDAPVRSLVRMPQQRADDSRSQYRRFQMFAALPDPKDGGKVGAAVSAGPVSSTVDPNAATDIPGRRRGPVSNAGAAVPIPQERVGTSGNLDSGQVRQDGGSVASERAMEVPEVASPGGGAASPPGDSRDSPAATQPAEGGGFVEEELW